MAEVCLGEVQGMNRPSHPNAIRLGLTWLEPEDLCYSGGFTRRAFVKVCPNEHNPLHELPIGSLRIVHCGIPDTYFSISARMLYHGTRLSDDVFTFTPEADPARCTHCQPNEGCKR